MQDSHIEAQALGCGDKAGHMELLALAHPQTHAQPVR